MLAVINADVYTPMRIIAHDGVVLLDGERIAAVGRAGEVPLPDGTEILDAAGSLVCPGYVDIHVHGGAGADASDASPEAVHTIAGHLLRAGTTSFFPTTTSAPLEQVWRAFDCLAAAMDAPAPMEARILGIHMEGPFLNPQQAGAHDPSLLRMPTAAEREMLYGYTGHLARVTLAPEQEGALELVHEISSRGVLVSAGHSDALYAQVCQAMNLGLAHITHLWSAMSSVRRIGPKRHSGVLEAALVEDGLTAEIIADGYHLPTSLMKMAYRMKGAERLCLVSDAMRATGLGPGKYEIGGVTALVEEGAGVAITADRTAFAGSISTMAQCVEHAVHVVGISLPDALRMATETPARIMGVANRVGLLAPGLLADLLILDRSSLMPRTVVQGGRVVA